MHRPLLGFVGIVLAVGCFATASPAQQVGQQGLMGLMGRIGLDAATLAASGASAQDVQSSLAALAQATEAGAPLVAASASVDSTSAALAAAMAEPEASPQSIAQLQAQCVSAHAAADAATETLRHAATAGLAAVVVARLEQCLAAAEVDAPVAFKVVSRTAESWAAIRSALRVEQRAQRLGAEVPSEDAALLASVRADPAVADASSLVAANAAQFESLLAVPAG